MTTPGWKEVFAIFEEAAELPQGERPAFLDGACETSEIRKMVEEMLVADEQDETSTVGIPIIDRPVKNWRDGVLEAEADMPSDLGPYRILRQVGQGGMSTVYLAVRSDDAFRRQVVVKLVRRGMETEPFLRRLRTERQILANLEHPYIARLYDGGSTGSGLPYFVMEYIEGESIDKYCDHNELSVNARLELFRKVCAAVHYAHQNLVIHRDIKPSNILVTADGDPKLLDFGIARLLRPDLVSEEVEPTATWQRIMTPSYASPEQLRGQQVATVSDVYSLGVLLYKLLSGKLPRNLRGLTQSQIERLLADTEPLRPSAAVFESSDTSTQVEAPATNPSFARALERQLAGDLDAIVLKALRSSPTQRYGSVEQLDSDIHRYLQGLPVEARVGSWRYRAGKFVRRHRAAVAAAVVAVAVLVGFAAAMIAQSAQVARERDQARLERDKKQEVLALILDIFRFSNPYVLPGKELTVREAISRSVPVLDAGLRRQPEVRSELLHTSGSILSILRDYGSAEHQLEEALELRLALHGEANVDVVQTMSALAAVRKELGELDDAEALAQRSVEIARGLGVDPQRALVPALNELVGVHCHRSQHEAAASPAQDALDLARQMPSGEQEIRALESLAQIDTSRGEYAGAAILYRKALALRRERYGQNHPVLIDSLSNLGLVLRRNEDFAASEAVYKELIELQRASFGEDYRDPLTLANLAGLRYGQGDYSTTMELYQQALEEVLKASGGDHWMVYVFQVATEDARIQHGDPVEAELRLRSLLDVWRPKLGEDHWRIAQGESVLGESLSLQGQYEEAEPLLTESYRKIVEGARERQKQDALKRLREHLERSGKPEAVALYGAAGVAELTGSL